MYVLFTDTPTIVRAQLKATCAGGGSDEPSRLSLKGEIGARMLQSLKNLWSIEELFKLKKKKFYANSKVQMLAVLCLF